MNSFRVFRLFDRRARHVMVAAAGLLLAAVLPAIVSAAQVTERSIQLSSSSAGAKNVTYQINFKAAENAGAFVVDFCSNTPVIGQACTAPVGFDVTDATSATTGFTDVTEIDANTVVVAGTIDTSVNEGVISVDLAGVDNPDAAGPLYARIVTYLADTDADSYQSETLGSNTRDQGSLAISITPTVGVSGSVLESLVFCVSGVVPGDNCTATDAPTVVLGEDSGSGMALTTTVSEGSIHAQISTNAVNGAMVRLKSNATGCGGLILAEDRETCHIAPAMTGGIAEGEAKFGVKVAAAADNGTGENATGALRVVNNYNALTFTLNYDEAELTGVTSTYGDQIFDTTDAPANNKNMQLTFGAAISNSTPAGQYSADLSLIATGKY